MEKYYLDVKCQKKKNTKNHRPAMWEGILATVYAMNSKKEIKYFDYKYEEAKKFAELGDDLRVWKSEWHWVGGPAKGDWVLWTN